MRRRFHQFLRLLSLAGLVLCVALGGVSHAMLLLAEHRTISTPAQTPGGMWIVTLTDRGVASVRGRLALFRSTYESGDMDQDALRTQWAGTQGWSWELDPGVRAGLPWWKWDAEGYLLLGAGYLRSPWSSDRTLLAPWWLLALVVGAPWLAHAIPAWRRAWRVRRGLCPACGYSRAGAAPGAICPECGHRATRYSPGSVSNGSRAFAEH